MRLAEHHKDITKELARYGIKPEIEPTNGGHIRFCWTAGSKQQCLTAGKTPSDFRAPENNILRVKRMMKEAGLQPLPRRKHNGNKEHVSKARSLADLETRIEQIEDTIDQLSRDVQMLLDRFTTPDVVPEDTPAPAPEPTKKRGHSRKRKDLTPLWRVLRYDEWTPLPVIVKAIGRTTVATSVLLDTLKKKGLVQNQKRVGWRKDRKVDQL